MFGSPLGEPGIAQRLRWDRIRDVGCLACRLRYPRMGSVPCEIHHLTVGGRHGAPRLGHEHTIGLCTWHHRGESDHPDKTRLRRWIGPSYAREPSAFREEFGDDDFLLMAQNELLAAHRSLTSIFPGVSHEASA